MAAAVAVFALASVGDGRRADRTSAGIVPTTGGPVQLVPAVRLGLDSGHGGTGPRGAPRLRWDSRELRSASPEISFDLSLHIDTHLSVRVGSSGPELAFTRSAAGALSLSFRGRSYGLRPQPGWPAVGAVHVELTGGPNLRVAVDGKPVQFPGAASSTGRLSFTLAGGGASAKALVISQSTHRAALLLHRLAELHARVPPGSLLVGADRADNLHFRTMWTSGFLPGALWQAAALQPAGGLFRGWALEATVKHFGLEHDATHDLGFMYGQSSLTAWRALCRPHASRSPICRRLVASVLQAADTLLALAKTDPGSGTIPTNATSRVGQTIVDSMMNIGILTWASRYTHRHVYARLASHQAHVIGSLLVRPNGSTIQAVHFNRGSGRIEFLGTHQGLSDSSTWSRGQGWGLYGFAQTAADLHDRGLLQVAQRIAEYVAAHLPASGVPPWDYDAGPRAPVDVSAGMITAAGMFHLAATCRRLPGICADPAQWVALGRTMLTASLGRASERPPIGFLGSQVLNERASTCCNGGELIFGLTYALEALRLAARPGDVNQ